MAEQDSGKVEVEQPQEEKTAKQEVEIQQTEEATPKQQERAAEASKEAPQEASEEEDDGVPKVLVTGASGFIAQHVIKLLLEQGRFRVRGSVRNKKKEEKVKPLLELVPDAKYPLRLVEADLQNAQSWVKAVKGCTYVFHVASPVSLEIPKDEQVFVRPAVEGTVNILQACADTGTVKRVILTSSIAAVSISFIGNPGNPPDYVYSDKDWSDEASCPPYEKSKLKAEQAAWEFVKKLSDEKRFELVVINPGYVQGPVLTRIGGGASRELCQLLLTGGLPLIPDNSFGTVDVRDVAAAHIAGLEKPEAAGNRYILVSETVHTRDIAAAISEEFGPQGYKPPSMNMPKILLWTIKLFNTAAKKLYQYWGPNVQFNNEPVIRELDIQLRPVKESIIDMCYSLIEHGFVNKNPGYLGHPSTRVPPPAESKPEEMAESKPEEPAESKPEEPAETNPEEPAESIPEDPAETKPEEMAESIPEEPAEML